jgi:hypothetical protein
MGDFSLNQRFKTFMGTMLPPGDGKWQLIFPNGTTCIKKCNQLLEYQHFLLLRDI